MSVQKQLVIPIACKSADRLGLVLADQGEVGVVIETLLGMCDGWDLTVNVNNDQNLPMTHLHCAPIVRR